MSRFLFGEWDLKFFLFYCIVSLCKERCTTVHELSQLKKCENLIDYRVEWTELKSISTLRMIKVRQIFFFIFFVFLWFFPFFSIYPTFPDQKSDLIDFKVQIKVSKFEKTSLIAFQTKPNLFNSFRNNKTPSINLWFIQYVDFLSIFK